MLKSKRINFYLINLVLLSGNIALFFAYNAQKTSAPELNSATDSVASTQFSPVELAPLTIEVTKSDVDIIARQEKDNAARQQARLKSEQLKHSIEENKRLMARISQLSNKLQEKEASLIAQSSENEALLQKINAQTATAPKRVKGTESDKMRDRIQIKSTLSANSSRPTDAEAAQTTPGEDSVAIDDNVVDKDSQEFIDKISGSVSLGFKYEQDNVTSRSIDGRLVVDYNEPDIYNISNDLKFEFESENDKMTTEKFRWQLQVDSNIDHRNTVFARGDIQRSEFSSYNRENIYTVGYGRLVFDDIKHKFNIEIGPGYRMAEPNAGKDAVSVDEFILRTRLVYSRSISESLQISMDAVLEAGRSNSTYAYTFEAKNKIYRELYLVFDFEFKYTENVPVDTVNKEVSTGFSLLYAF